MDLILTGDYSVLFDGLSNPSIGVKSFKGFFTESIKEFESSDKQFSELFCINNTDGFLGTVVLEKQEKAIRAIFLKGYIKGCQS